MRIVVDTNVLISGTFFSGTPSVLVDACFTGDLELVVSPEILAEYTRVGEEFTGKIAILIVGLWGPETEYFRTAAWCVVNG